ncbi:MAG: ATP-dependent 6-phosphofructokinase [Armatimonadetes bacterium]|nr:ATP-dependent 6-phosphofructokinase [Armatimonadota bacterium]
MKIAVLTSGGDAPGMNACIRAVVRCTLNRGWEALGSRYGYNGLVSGELIPLSHNLVSNTIQRGGTVLGAGRCDLFETAEGLTRAAETLRSFGVAGLVAIGGDGTFRGLRELSALWDGLCIGIPGTVDNDATGSDYAIGFDTAVNTALEAIDRIRDTAESYERTFIVEVMGRGSGAIALAAALAGGAEEVCIPETPTDYRALAERLNAGKSAGRASSIIVCAEGDELGGAEGLKQRLQELSDLKFRTCILGHIQRGGAPTARDRILASRLGAYAVQLISEGTGGVVVGEIAGKPATTPLTEVGKATAADKSDAQLIQRLSR